MKVIKLYFLLCSGVLFAQINTAQIAYKITNDEPLMTQEEKLQNPSIVGVFEQVEVLLDEIQFKLNYCNGVSIFNMEKSLSMDNNVNKITETLADNTIYFMDPGQKKFVCMKSFLGESFKVLFEPVSHWKFSTEFKMIDGYKCFKAITKKNATDSEYNVIAWYCPELPIHVGPKSYGGLPGLILELKEGRMTYRATNVLINPDIDCDLSLKSNKKEISMEAYNQLVKSRAENIKATMGN